MIRCPIGVAEDIPVKIRGSLVPVDFVVLEMDVCLQTPLILGRPFLSTAGANIDVAASIIKLNINGKEETFAFKPKGTEQCNLIMESPERKLRRRRNPKKKPDAAQDSIWKSKRHVKPTAPQSLAASAA